MAQGGVRAVVLVDLNDTALDDRTGRINVGKLELAVELGVAKEHGLIVGLCSDSPFDPMVEWAAEYGVSGPIVAEGGLVLFGEPLIEIDVAEIRATVDDWCADNDLAVADEPVIAIEFGGEPPQVRPCLAFGEGRICSVSMFTYSEGDTGGLTDKVAALGAVLEADYGSAVDVNLTSGVIIVHHRTDFRDTKRRFLRELGTRLNAHGVRLYMVGNSRSDVVEAPHLCRVIMVGNATPEGKAGADVVVEGEYTVGVIEALSLIATELGRTA